MKLFLILLLCVPAFGQQILIKNEAAGRCEYKSTKDGVHVFDCVIMREDGESKKWTLDVSDAQYPPPWERPDAKKIYLVGRGTDGNIYAVRTPIEPSPTAKPFQHVPNLHEKCKDGVYRGQECSGEVLRHPLDLGKRKP